MAVISFEGYRPAARYDDLPWTEAVIQEAVSRDGPWVDLETIPLDPVDPDPTQPLSRDLTTELASDTIGLWYRIIFQDADSDQSQPTAPVQNTAVPTVYVLREELKAAASLQGTDFSDDDIDLAIEAASRAVDGYKRTRFYPTTETRYYNALRSARWVAIDDLVTLTTAKVDMDGDGVYETTWTNGTDFILDPANASLESLPSRRLTLLDLGGRRFPRYERGVEITGSFGWSSAPALVRQATKILATRLLVRSRQAPLGILTVGTEVGAAARLGKLDPDVAFLLDQLPGTTRPGLVSVQLS